ncbi:MAG: TfoX/Sxy family DNA transformation protein [Planctomycetales bacterium]|nr:TfoX/Sxy family DNA transformation protein [Planctomycetales bacterium]
MTRGSNMSEEESQPIQQLRNIGPQSSIWLRAVGINTIGDLRRLGPALAYRLVCTKFTGSLNLLWALAAGLEGRDWRELTEKEKQDLKASLAEMADTRQ